LSIDPSVIVILALLAVLFIPFAPFRPVKKIILFLFNRYIPLPIKFEDIGGIPIIGMKMKNVQIKLGGGGSLEADEMHIKVQFWRMLMLRRPSLNPIALHRPRIKIKQMPQQGEVWFLFPLTAMKWVVSNFFMHLWGLNIVRIYRGSVTIEGANGKKTYIEDLNGEFTSHGNKMKVRRMSCMVGAGSLDIHYPRKGPMSEGRVIVRNLRLEDLSALKVPKHLHGPISVEAAMFGSINDIELVGNISSPGLFMRDAMIHDFHSPLRFKGTSLMLEKMQGRIGEYALEGSLVTDVVTDISEMILRGGGRGKASQSILKMLAMKPFIKSGWLDADILLEGDLNKFYEFSGDIKLHIKDAVIDFAEIGEGSMKDFPLAPIPEAKLALELKKGILTFKECEAISGQLRLAADGHIEMRHDPVEDKVGRSLFNFRFNVDSPNLADLIRQLNYSALEVSGAANGEFVLDCDYGNNYVMESEDKIKMTEAGDYVFEVDTPAFHKLEGRGHVSAKNVSISGIPAALTNNNPIMRRLNIARDFSFDVFEGDIVLEKDRIKAENVRCAGEWLEVSLSGSSAFFGEKPMSADIDLFVVGDNLRSKTLIGRIPGVGTIVDMLKAGIKVTKKGDGKPEFKMKSPLRAPSPASCLLPPGTSTPSD